MATNPTDLLLAAGIFGDPRKWLLGGMFDPAHQAEMARRNAELRRAPPVPLAPNPAQGPDESDLLFGARRAVQAPLDFAYRAVMAPIDLFGAAHQDAVKATKELTTTPRQREAAATRSGGGGGSPFPTSFADPAYDQAEAYASKLTGVPQMLLRQIRMNGERSNANQVSSAGARTPYQIIPKTAAGIKQNYGIDPLSNPVNAALGAAYVLREQAGNPGPGEWNPQRVTRAVGGYFGGGAGAANPFSSATDANGQTVGGYTQRVLGPDTQLPIPGMLNPYDPSYDAMAMKSLGAERAALMQPSEFTMDRGPAPELPKPAALPVTDFTNVDKALEAMRPIEMSEKDRLSRERDGFFQGIAKAMMQAPANEGLGTFFMRLGGAALGGKIAAKDDIRREQEKFDNKMAQFNAAVFHNEMGKAKVHADELQAQVAQTNQYNLDNWKVAYDRWKGSGNIDISGTNAVITSEQNGRRTVRILPIEGAVDAAIAQQSANLWSSIGGRQMAGNQQVTSMNNAIMGRAAIASMMRQSGSLEADGAASANAAFYGTYIAQNGLTADVLGPDGAKSLEDNVNKQMMGMGLQPGTKDWIDRRDRIISNELTKLGLASPDMMQRMMKAGVAAPSFEALDAARKARTSTSTDSRGYPTTRTTGPSFTGNASDVFDSDEFNQELLDHGYTRR